MTDWLWSVLTSTAGTTAVVGIVTYIFRNLIEERLKAAVNHQYDVKMENTRAQIKAEFDRELETLKGQFQRHFLVYKAQFEVEFETYRKLWAASTEAIDRVARLVAVYAMVERADGQGTKQGMAEAADAAFFDANKLLLESEPFIPREIHEGFVRMLAAAKAEIDGFFGAIRDEASGRTDYDPLLAEREARTALNEICRRQGAIANQIRSRIETLQVIG